MRRRIVVGTLVAIIIAVISASVPTGAREIVEIVLNGKYYPEPATVRFVVAVEPDAENRTLRIEADSADMFQASEITLNGAEEKRLHAISFKNLQAGRYRLRATVLSNEAVRGTATDSVVVTGVGLR